MARAESEVTPMRVLVVHHDVAIADAETDSLRRAGFEVEQCLGPIGGAPCPIPAGQPCEAIARADVLIYDVWATGDSESSRSLVEGIRDRYPSIPLVLTAPGMELDWVETSGPHGVVPLVGLPTAGRLSDAIDRAVSSSSSPDEELQPA